MDEKMKTILNNLKSEIKTLRSVKHKNIIRYYDVKKEKNKIYIITEYCNNGDLTNFILSNNFSETEILYYFSQILDGFKYMR
jgi:serine/threonine protein kinase